MVACEYRGERAVQLSTCDAESKPRSGVSKRFNAPTPFKTEVENTETRIIVQDGYLRNLYSDPANKSEELVAEATGLAQRASNLTGGAEQLTNGKRTSWFPDLFLPIADKMERTGRHPGGMEPIADQKSQKQESPELEEASRYHPNRIGQAGKTVSERLSVSFRRIHSFVVGFEEKEGRLPHDTLSTLYKSLRNQGFPRN